MEEILSIVKLVMQNSDIDLNEHFSTDADIKDVLGFDSFALAELTVRIEEKYGIDIFESGSVSSISDILKKLDITNETEKLK